MLCKSPFVRDPTGKVFKASLLTGDRDIAVAGIPFPCGQCLPCRINKRRLWTHRLMLESYQHAESIFVTLTYADEYLPSGGTLDKKALQKFLKRLRYFCTNRSIRYYAVGEYGAQTHRPHYHAIIFGLGLSDGEMVAQAWPFGRVHVGECNVHTVQYVAGYVTKKFIKRDDSRVQEFSTMSRKPGIGYGALDELVKLIRDPQYKHLFQGDSTIPDGLRHGNRFLPFDRYLKGKLCKLLEYDPDVTEYIRSMHEKYIQSVHSGKYKEDYLANALIEESVGRNVQIERRNRIFNTRSKI
nr:MAG: replication initiator protein [Microviridae sp.]